MIISVLKTVPWVSGFTNPDPELWSWVSWRCCSVSSLLPNNRTLKGFHRIYKVQYPLSLNPICRIKLAACFYVDGTSQRPISAQEGMPILTRVHFNKSSLVIICPEMLKLENQSLNDTAEIKDCELHLLYRFHVKWSAGTKSSVSKKWGCTAAPLFSQAVTSWEEPRPPSNSFGLILFSISFDFPFVKNRLEPCRQL